MGGARSWQAVIGVGVALALLLPPMAAALRYSGKTDQIGGPRVELHMKGRGAVQKASIQWTARCGRGGTRHGTVRLRDFDRRGRSSFQEKFNGHVNQGKTKAKVRYVFFGKREDSDSYFGTFRLVGRYQRGNDDLGNCRTRLVRWTADLDSPD